MEKRSRHLNYKKLEERWKEIEKRETACFCGKREKEREADKVLCKDREIKRKKSDI